MLPLEACHTSMAQMAATPATVKKRKTPEENHGSFKIAKTFEVEKKFDYYTAITSQHVNHFVAKSRKGAFLAIKLLAYRCRINAGEGVFKAIKYKKKSSEEKAKQVLPAAAGDEEEEEEDEEYWQENFFAAIEDDKVYVVSTFDFAKYGED